MEERPGAGSGRRARSFHCLSSPPQKAPRSPCSGLYGAFITSAIDEVTGHGGWGGGLILPAAPLPSPEDRSVDGMSSPPISWTAPLATSPTFRGFWKSPH